MKTKQMIVGMLLLLLSYASAAGTPQRMLSFFSKNGIVLQMPVMEEEAVDSVPLNIMGVFNEFRSAMHRPLFEHQFDLDGLVQPEADADDVIIDTAAIFKRIRGCCQTKK